MTEMVRIVLINLALLVNHRTDSFVDERIRAVEPLRLAVLSTSENQYHPSAMLLDLMIVKFTPHPEINR